MAQLNSLIGSILRDIIRAQHEANLYSLSLKEAYGEYGKAKDFRIPGALLGELELDLKYAVQKTDTRREESETDYPALRRFLGELSEQLARIAITNVTATTSQTDVQVGQNTQALNLLLEQEKDLWDGFGPFLGRKISEALTGQATSLVNPDGTLQKELLLGNVMQTVETQLLANPDLEQLFGAGATGNLRQTARTNLSNTLTVLIAKRVKDYNFVRTTTFSSPEIIVTADELKKLPADAIHSVHIRVSPLSYLPDEPIINPTKPTLP